MLTLILTKRYKGRHRLGPYDPGLSFYSSHSFLCHFSFLILNLSLATCSLGEDKSFERTQNFRWKDAWQGPGVRHCLGMIVGDTMKPVLVDDICIRFFLFFPPLSLQAPVRTGHTAY